MDMTDFTVDALGRVRAAVPLVHNITNFVAMNSSANILLALGAAPVMAHSPDEVEEMVGLAGALVLNIGTLDRAWVEAMLRAGRAANARGVPVVLDPVGAGATRLRTDSARRILGEVRVSLLRGNASEVFSVLSDAGRTRGVDSATGVSPEVLAAAEELARRQGCVVGISGAVDTVTDGTRRYQVANGHALMTRVTGLGCGLSAVCGAFAAVAGASLIEAVTAAFGVYGLCGEMAAHAAPHPGAFATAFIDALAAVGPAEIRAGLRVQQA